MGVYPTTLVIPRETFSRVLATEQWPLSVSATVWLVYRKRQRYCSYIWLLHGCLDGFGMEMISVHGERSSEPPLV